MREFEGTEARQQKPVIAELIENLEASCNVLQQELDEWHNTVSNFAGEPPKLVDDGRINNPHPTNLSHYEAIYQLINRFQQISNALANERARLIQGQ